MPRPRHGEFQSAGTSSSVEEALYLINKLTNVQPPLSTAVADLLQSSKSTGLSLKIALDSKIIENLCLNIEDDYVRRFASDLVNTRGRLIKLKLLVSLSSFVAADKDGRNLLAAATNIA